MSTLIPFPDVPDVQGVPPVPRDLNFPFSVPAEDTSDGPDLPQDQPTSQWGIFTSDQTPVIVATSTVSLDFRNDSRVSDYPLEKGAFASYNKVATPYSIPMRISCDGNLEERSAFLDALEAMLASIDLYTVVTPEKSYLNATLARYDYRRESRNGVTLLIADLMLEEARLTAQSQYSQVKSTSAADPVSDGQVQATEPDKLDESQFQIIQIQ